MRGALSVAEAVEAFLAEEHFSTTAARVLARLEATMTGYAPSLRMIGRLLRDRGWESRRERSKGGGSVTVYRPGRNATIGAGTGVVSDRSTRSDLCATQAGDLIDRAAAIAAVEARRSELTGNPSRFRNDGIEAALSALRTVPPVQQS